MKKKKPRNSAGSATTSRLLIQVLELTPLLIPVLATHTALLVPVLATHTALLTHRLQGSAAASRDRCAMLLLSLAAVSFARFARHPPTLSPRRLGTPALSDGGDEAAIDRQMAEIGAPALVGLSIEPVASLVDTAFVGRCCATADLAGVGIGVGIFNLVAKAFNFLSPATTSLVAAASPESEPGEFTTPMLQAVSASLAVASVAGLGIAAALTLGAGRLLNTLGIAAGSPMRPSAVAYLLLRGLSAPASLGLCCIQGAFRGARDTRTPLLGLATVTAVNVALDAAFIPARALGWGAAGAAGATAAAQYAGAAVMLRQLLRRCGESSLQLPRRRDVVRLLSSGSVLTLRTLAVLGTISYSSLLAARVGAASGAAHQVCLQLWLAASLLADAVAIAAQALLANVAAARRTSAARTVVQRTLRAGCATGLGTAAALSIGGRSLFRLFAADPAVLAAAAAAWPAVVASQPLNTLAFAADGRAAFPPPLSHRHRSSPPPSPPTTTTPHTHTPLAPTSVS